MLKKQMAELQKQLAGFQKKDHTATLTKRVAELEGHLTEAKSSTTTAPAPNTALPRATSGATGPRPTGFIPPRKSTCRGCRDPRHRLWACPKLPNAEKRELYCRKIRRIGQHSRPLCIIVRNTGNRHSNADGLSRRAPPPIARHEAAVEFAGKSTNKEQLNATYDTDIEQDELMDSEQSELEEQIPNARPVHAPEKEQAETEVKSSVRESLAARQQSDPELGKLVRLRLQSAEQPALSLLSTESESAKRLFNQWERLEVQEGLIRRRVEGKPGQQPYSQLLVLRQSMQDVLHCCYEGMTGGHKSSDDFTGSPGRRTRSVSASVASLAVNITEGSSDVRNRYSLLSLSPLTSGGISI